MRIWLHTSTKSVAVGPSGAVSLLAHAALIGGAVYGTGRASIALQESVAERIYFLPPRDRTPSVRHIAERVRYVAAGAGALKPPSPTGSTPAGAGGESPHRSAEQSGADAATEELRVPIAGIGDSVYSILNVDESAARVDGSGAPAYPAALIEQHLEGSVQARFEIDSSGHIDPASVEIMGATHPAFAQSVRDAIPLMRFSAGSVAGRHVRQLVAQNFLFKLLLPPPVAADHTRAAPPE